MNVGANGAMFVNGLNWLDCGGVKKQPDAAAKTGLVVARQAIGKSHARSEVTPDSFRSGHWTSRIMVIASV
jgi:hypothetical protein